MTNIFERELYKIFGDDTLAGTVIQGKSLIGKIDNDLRAKISWWDRSVKDSYDNLRVEIINRKEGKVDTKAFDLTDILGTKKVRSDLTVHPHIWSYREAEWYGYTPTDEDRQRIWEVISEYINIWRG